MKEAAEENGTKAAIHMLYERELLDQIEDYRFRKRFPSRAEAIKALVRLGLESDEKKNKGPGPRR